MVDSQDFLVTREVALRTGDIQYKYRTEDGRFIVDSRTLSRIRFTSEEMISGLQGIEMITHEEAETLIARNGYKMGDSEESAIHSSSSESSSSEEEEQVETGQEETEE